MNRIALCSKKMAQELDVKWKHSKHSPFFKHSLPKTTVAFYIFSFFLTYSTKGWELPLQTKKKKSKMRNLRQLKASEKNIYVNKIFWILFLYLKNKVWLLFYLEMTVTFDLTWKQNHTLQWVCTWTKPSRLNAVSQSSVMNMADTEQTCGQVGAPLTNFWNTGTCKCWNTRV